MSGNSKDSDDDSGHAQQTVHTSALPPQESKQPRTSDPTSSTGSSPTLPFTFNVPVDWAIDMDNTTTAIDVLTLHLAMT